MFPEADDGPAGFFEGAVDEAVAALVGGEFLFPEGTVVGGEIGVPGTGVLSLLFFL